MTRPFRGLSRTKTTAMPLVRLCKRVCFAVDFFWSRMVRVEDDAVAERSGSTFLDGELEGRLFGIEDAAAQRIRRKQTVPASVPVGGIAGIAGVVDHRDSGSVRAGVAGERTPTATSRPHCAALDAFAGEVDARCIFGVGGVDLGGLAVGVHEDATLFIRRLKPVRDTHSEHTFFVIVENGFVEGGKRDGLVDGALAVVLAEDVLRRLLQDVLASARGPDRSDNEFSAIG